MVEGGIAAASGTPADASGGGNQAQPEVSEKSETSIEENKQVKVRIHV